MSVPLWCTQRQVYPFPYLYHKCFKYCGVREKTNKMQQLDVYF